MNVSSKPTIALEEVFPFPFYWVRRRKQLARVSSENLGAVNGPNARYHQLSDDQLDMRVREERERAKAMDEKTFKMILSLTVGLTVLGSTTSLLVKGVPFEHLRFFIAIFAALSIFYSLAAGLTALGALKTLRSYGYGTDFLLQVKDDKTVHVHALAAQEAMNIIRHLRNECAYQSLRNGFLCLFLALGLFAGALAINTFRTEPPASPLCKQSTAPVITPVEQAISLENSASNQQPPVNRVRAGVNPALPTPPDVRVRIRRFIAFHFG